MDIRWLRITRIPDPCQTGRKKEDQQVGGAVDGLAGGPSDERAGSEAWDGVDLIRWVIGGEEKQAVRMTGSSFNPIQSCIL